MDFLEWNNKLASYFFNEEMDGREVLLNVSEQTIEKEIGGRGDTLNSFLEAIKAGPPWATREGLCMKAYQAYDNWRSRSLSYPPYLSYLILFVLANDVDGDFDSKAYYPRLRQLIGESPESGPLPSFDKMFDLWCDLEKWSKEDKHEELGSFTPRFRGGYVHIGLPLSQTLLTREERMRLPLLFDEANLEPGSSTNAKLILNIMKEYGRRYLSARTVRLLSISDTEFSELRNALVQFVQDDLLSWDGHLPAITDGGGQAEAISKIGLRLCLKVAPFQEISSYLRLRLNRTIPETTFAFASPHSPNNEFSCLQSAQRWSTPVSDLNSGERINGFDINWMTDFDVRDLEREWKAKLKGSSTRLFTNGRSEGLPASDWVESTQLLQRGAEFIVTCTSDHADRVREWITKSCEPVGEQQKVLPNGWNLFRAKNARASCEGVSGLTFSPELNLRLRGGFKVGRGNRYFRFGLPEILLENSDGHTVRASSPNGIHYELVQISDSEESWRFPDNLPGGQSYKVEVLKDNTPAQLRKHYSVTVVNDSDLVISNRGETLKRRSDGEIIRQPLSENHISGAAVTSDQIGEAHAYNFLPLQLASKVVLIGQRPGQICEFPLEPLPNDWDPVWILAKKHHDAWTVCFCGRHLNLSPAVAEQSVNISRRKRWKEAVWVLRRQHDLKRLRLKSVLKLWEAYKIAGQNL